MNVVVRTGVSKFNTGDVTLALFEMLVLDAVAVAVGVIWRAMTVAESEFLIVFSPQYGVNQGQ